MPSVYRTALGKQIDIDKVRLLNEETVAIGNMRVNARGDELDRSGKIKQSKEDRVVNNRSSNKKYNFVKDEPVVESRAAAANPRPTPVKNNNADLQATIEKLQKELAEKDALLLKQQAEYGKTLREAVADQPLVEEIVEETVEEEPVVLAPKETEEKPLRGGLAAAIQKNLELQSKKTKPKRI